MRERVLIIMQGVPGSGKSTVANAIASSHRTLGFSVIRSTDEYWGPDYKFDIARLGKAHEWNQDRVLKDMMARHPLIIVDNTNIKKSAVAPYVEMAKRHGYTVEYVRVSVPIEIAKMRNANRPEGRRVPEEVIDKMLSDMEDLSGS